MSALIAVDGCEVDHSAGSPIDAGSFSITSVPSKKILSNGAGAFYGSLDLSFAGGNAEGFSDGSVFAVAVSIPPTAQKTKTASNFVMREGDSVAMICTGTIDPVPPSPPYTAIISGDIEISNAGQTVLLSK